MSGPDFVMEIPPDWKTGEWDRIDTIATGKLPYGECLLVMASLDDGTNIMAVTWPAGQRLARTGPATKWGVQEHYTGRSPKAGEDVIDRLWKKAIEILIEAVRMADAELGRPR